MIKKAVYLLILLLLLVSCGTEKNEITKITVMTEGDAQCWNDIEIENYEIHVEQVPEGTLAERVLNADTYPDIVYLKSKEDMELLKDKLVGVDDVQLDGYDRAKFSNEDYAEIEAAHADEDGEHYVFPDYSAGRDAVEHAWLYRADIFEKNGIEIPATMSELTAVCYKLKEKYSESAPLVIKGGYYGLELVAPSWKNDASLSAYYDFKAEKWAYGLSEPWAGNFISYWASMYKARLVPENYLTMKDDEAEKLIAENRAFIVPDYVYKMDEYNEKYPGQDWRIMPPPGADIETGQHKIAKCEASFVGVAVIDGGKEAKALEVVDRFFLNYVTKEPESNENIRLARIYTENRINPSRYINLPDGEAELRVKTHLHGMLTAFLKGEISMTRWADFAAQLEEKGIEEMKSRRKAAYNSAKK